MAFPDLDLDSLRAFVAVAESGSFTAAADLVGRSQSAVSQRVLRLERSLGRRLFDRTSRTLSLTGDGERLLAMARRLLDLNDATVRALREPAAAGTLRLGISEDFIPHQLPRLLARFKRLYPGVHLQLMTGLSCALVGAYDAGELDAVIAKKDGTAQRGRVLWREPLAWLAAADFVLDPDQPVPLVLLPPPCTYREVMRRTLDAARRPWVAACTAGSLMAVQAAVAGGLGVSVLGRSFIQDGLQRLRPPPHWPALPVTEIVLIGERGPAADLIRPLTAFLTENLTAAA